MVAVSQDVDYAFAGVPVTLEATSLSGDRARFKVVSKPYDSGVVLYNDNDKNYLEQINDTRAKFVPDAPGYYEITALDENVTINVKHFSNDGGSGLSKGIATATTVASASYTLRVGEQLQREFGHAQDTCTMTVHAHNIGALSGVLTYRAGAGYAPSLSGSTSPVMDMALRSTGVTKVRNYYGMASGYTDSSAVLLYTSLYEDPATTLARIATGFNRHIALASVATHDANDTTNKMSAVTKPSTLPTLITYCNTQRGKVNAHLALGTGAAHKFGPDATNVITHADATTLATCRTLLNQIRTNVTAHRVLFTTTGHYPPGDNEEDSLMPWNVPNVNDVTSAIISYATSIASAWDNHLGVGSGGSGYHSATGSVNEMYAPTGIGGDELKERVNDCIDKFEAHCSNRVAETGSSVVYHQNGGSAYPDLGGVVPFRASDRASTVKAIEHLHWAYLNHTVYGGSSWHNTHQNPGNAYVTPSGATERLQHAILDRIGGNDTSTPPNTLEGVVNLIKVGFTKAQ